MTREAKSVTREAKEMTEERFVDRNRAKSQARDRLEEAREATGVTREEKSVTREGNGTRTIARRWRARPMR